MPKSLTPFSLFHQLVFWLSKPLRKYLQYKMRVSIYRDIEHYKAELRLRKPHWNDKQIQKRAYSKYWLELRKIGVV